jgi:mannose-1-phosphate guanylyltransferase
VKAFLLAAGHGTRLRPLTDQIPKCLVPIRGVAMLEIWFEACRRARIDQILINLHAHADAVRHVLPRCSNGLEVEVVEEPELLGSAGTLLANRDWVADEPYYWVFYADVLTNVNLSKMFTFHCRTQPQATLGLYQVRDPRRCGIVTFDKSFTIREFVEKPDHPRSNWAFSGIILAGSGWLDGVSPSFPLDLGSHVLPSLVGKIKGYPISEYLLDIGTIENYQVAQQTWPGL